MTMEFSAHDINLFCNNNHPTIIESAEKLILRAALDGKKSATLPVVSGDSWLIPTLIQELEERGFRTVTRENDEERVIVIKW